MIQIQTTRSEAPEATFHNPLTLMSDCHRRIEMFFDRMIAIARHDRGGRLPDDRRDALDTALRYFAAGAPLHTADEEESLFPRLRALGTPEAEAALQAVAALEEDHRAAEVAHAEIDVLGRKWLNKGELSADDAQKFLDLLVNLREIYRGHIEIEDTQVFPLAGRILEAESIEKVGREMAGRRGLNFDNLPAVNRCAQRRARVG